MVVTSPKIRSYLKIFFEMNGNLMARYVASLFLSTLTNVVSLDCERLVGLFPPYFFLFLHHAACFYFRFGTYSVDEAFNAGLDLEMPGTEKWRTLNYVNRCVQARKLTVTTIKKRAKKVLELVKKCAQEAPGVSFIQLTWISP